MFFVCAGLGDLDLLGDLGGLQLGGAPAAPIGGQPLGGGGLLGAPVAPAGGGGLGALAGLGGGLDLFGGLSTAAASGFYSAPKSVSNSNSWSVAVSCILICKNELTAKNLCCLHFLYM